VPASRRPEEKIVIWQAKSSAVQDGVLSIVQEAPSVRSGMREIAVGLKEKKGGSRAKQTDNAKLLGSTKFGKRGSRRLHWSSVRKGNNSRARRNSVTSLV